MSPILITRQALRDVATHWAYICTFGAILICAAAIYITTTFATFEKIQGVDQRSITGIAVLIVIITLYFAFACVVAIAWHRMILEGSQLRLALSRPPVFRYLGVLGVFLIPFILLNGTLQALERSILFLGPIDFASLKEISATTYRFLNSEVGFFLIIFPINFGRVLVSLLLFIALPQVAIGRPAKVWEAIKFSARNIPSLAVISLLASIPIYILERITIGLKYRYFWPSHPMVEFVLFTPFVLFSTFLTFALLTRISAHWRPVD